MGERSRFSSWLGSVPPQPQGDIEKQLLEIFQLDQQAPLLYEPFTIISLSAVGGVTPGILRK